MNGVTKLATTNEPASDPSECKFVRITDVDHHGFVEFQFSIGDPNLYLEMTLPKAAFDEFCAAHDVQHLSAAQANAVDETELKWRFGDEVD
ncbi:MAG: phenol hydroxylase subunit [Gammaproteobacteria bacterium]